LKQITYRQQEIRPFLIKYLTEATEHIHLAIGWIDDDGLLALLQKKALEDIEVILLLIKDSNYNLKREVYKELINKGVRIIGLDRDRKDYFIDHKFVVIDRTVVMTGNYGWGHKNPSDEFANFTEDLPSLAQGFEMEFDYLSISFNRK